MKGEGGRSGWQVGIRFFFANTTASLGPAGSIASSEGRTLSLTPSHLPSIFFTMLIHLRKLRVCSSLSFGDNSDNFTFYTTFEEFLSRTPKLFQRDTRFVPNRSKCLPCVGFAVYNPLPSVYLPPCPQRPRPPSPCPSRASPTRPPSGW